MTDVAWLLEQLWGPIVAVTAEHDGRANGLISTTAITASLVPETPRLSLQLSRANLTHDLALAAGVFAVHLLAADETGLAIVRALGFHSGHDATKLDGLTTQRGETGAPILADAVAYAEARTSATLAAGALTVVVADVVAGQRLHDSAVLTIEDVRAHAPAAWLAEWEARRRAELEIARRFGS
jgi:flavin reductase (DIM6/NTAB) family NADH-FMN oxidoreductase RutF